MNEVPVFEWIISEDDNRTGVDFVALVDEPAISMNWQAFKEQKRKFQADHERRIISGPLMVANLPIYRNDERGEYYGIFRPQTIEKVALKFMKNRFTSNVNMMHDQSLVADGVYMFESFLIDEKRGIKAPDGYGDLPDGSWFGSFKVDNETIWNEYIKTGVFRGFSVEGIFYDQPLGDAPLDLIEELEKIILG